MFRKKSLVVVTLAAFAFSFSMLASALLLKKTSDSTTSDGSATSSGTSGTSNSYQGLQFELQPNNPLFSNWIPNVWFSFSEADDTPSGDEITGITKFKGAWKFTHSNSKTKLDTLQCTDATAGTNCLNGFVAKIQAPAAGELPAKIQVFRKSVSAIELYTIASIDPSTRTITIQEKLPTKTNGSVEETATVAAASVFVEINKGTADPNADCRNAGVDCQNRIYARIYEDRIGDEPEGNPEAAGFAFSNGSVTCDPLSDPFCPQDGYGLLFYKVAATRICTRVGTDLNDIGLGCTWTADVYSGQTGHVELFENNYNICWNGMGGFATAWTYIGDISKKNKPNIDLVYPFVQGIWERAEAFRLTLTENKGITALRQRGVNTDPCAYPPNLNPITDITFEGTFLTATKGNQLVSATATATPTQIGASSFTSDFKIDIFAIDTEVSGTTIANGLYFRFDNGFRRAIVRTSEGPACNFTTSECLHVKFLRLATLCGAAYVKGSPLLANVPFTLPIRAEFASGGETIGALVASAEVTPGQQDFTFDYSICTQPGVADHVTYTPPVQP